MSQHRNTIENEEEELITDKNEINKEVNEDNNLDYETNNNEQNTNIFINRYFSFSIPIEIILEYFNKN